MGYRCASQRIKIEPAQKLVGFNSARAKQFRQTPLRGPAHQGHLPKAVLGVGIAKAKEHVAVCRGLDVRDAGIVADDFDIGGDATDSQRLIVFR